MQKIPRAIGKASGVAIGETNSSATLSVEGGGLSTFAGLVTTRRGKPFSVLSINKNNFRDILGKAYHPTEAPFNYEAMRHLNQAVNGGPGYVVRVVPSDMEIPYIKISTPGNSTKPVEPVKVDPLLSTFTTMPGNVVGDGKTAIVLTFTPKDQYGGAIRGLGHVGFEAIGVSVKIDKIVERSGVYTANLTGVVPGKAIIRPTVANTPVGNLSRQISVDELPNQVATLDPDACTYWVSNNRLYADGKASITLFVKLVDNKGDALSIDASRVSFVGLGAVPVGITSAVEDINNPGTYSAKLSGRTVGSTTVLPTIDGGMIGDIKGSTIYLEKSQTATDTDGLNGDQSTLVASENSIDADGFDTVTLTFTARNTSGSLMPNLAGKLSLAIFGLTGATQTAFVERTSGVYVCDISVGRSSVGDRAEIHILHNSVIVSNTAVTLSVNRVKPQLPIVDELASSLSGTSHEAFATGGVGLNSAVTLTLTLIDTDSLPMPNRAVTFNIAGQASAGVIREETPGVYQIDIYSYSVGGVVVTPLLDGMPVGKSSWDITFKAPVVKVPVMDPARTAATFKVTPPSIPADNATTATLTLHVIDDDGNSMGGLSGILGVSSSRIGLTISAWNEGATGFYTTSVKTAQDGTYELAPTYNNNPISNDTTTLTATKVTPVPDATRTKFESSAATITDDGSQTATLKLTLRTAANRAISGMENLVGFRVSDAQFVSVTTATETPAGSGIYTATVTGKSVKGTVTIAAQYNGLDIGGSNSVTITLNDPAVVQPPIAVDLSHSTLTTDKAQIRTDKNEVATLTFTALDANDQPITVALMPHLTFTPSISTGYDISAITSQGGGVYTATLRGTGAVANGDIVIDAVYNGSSIQVDDGANGTQDLEVIVNMAGAITVAQSTLSLSVPSIDADGVAKSVVSFTPRDANSNVIQNVAVGFTYTGVNSSSLVKGTASTSAGVTSQELSSTVPGSITIGVTVDGSTLPGETTNLQITSIVDKLASTFTANPTSRVGDGIEETTLTLTLKDKNGATMSGIASNIQLKAQSGGSDVSLGHVTFTDGTNGVYTATLSYAAATDTVITLTPVVFGEELTAKAQNVTFTAPVVIPTTPAVADSLFTSSLVPNTDPIADGTAVTFTVTLKNGQTMISGKSVELKTNPAKLTSTTISSMVETPANSGIYIGTISATAPDEFDVTVDVDGSAFALTAIHTKFVNAPVVVPTEPVVGDSSFAGSKASATANGTDKIGLTLVLKAGTTPIKGKIVTFEAAGKKATTTIGTVTESPDGTYKADITATAADSGTITVKVGGTAFAITGVPFAFTAAVPTEPVESDSTFTGSKASATADGIDKIGLTLVLKAGTTPIKGKTVTFEIAGKKTTTTIGPVSESPDGTYKADITATEADGFNVTVTVDGSPFAVDAVHASFNAVVPTTPTVADSTFTAGAKVAAGSGPVKLTLTLKNGTTLIEGKTVTFESIGKKATTTIGAVSESHGVYSADVTATAADSFNDVVVKIGGSVFAITSPTVEFDAPAHVDPTTGVVADSTFVSDLASGDKGVADNSTPVNITLTLKNGTDVVKGRAVTFEPVTANADVTIGAAVETPANSGIYKAAVTAKAATTVSIKVKVDGTDFAVAPLAIEFAAP